MTLFLIGIAAFVAAVLNSVAGGGTFVTFPALTGLAGLSAGGWFRRADAVIAMSPPLTMGLTGRLVAWAHRCPLVFNVQDIFPDAAIETADIALMSDDLAKLPWLVRHSRRALGIIRQNVAFALGVKAVFLVLTLVGHSSMWAAVAADSGATLLVVFNALRLLRK